MDQFEKMLVALFLHQLMWQNSFLFVILITYYVYGEEAFVLHEDKNKIRYNLKMKMPDQTSFLHNLVETSDVVCINMLRMDRSCFRKLCKLLQTRGGLQSSKNVSIKEQVAIFLNIIAHHTKIRVIGFHYMRSYYTISKYIKNVLRSIMIVHRYMLAIPQPVEEGSEDRSWKYFQVWKIRCFPLR